MIPLTLACRQAGLPSPSRGEGLKRSPSLEGRGWGRVRNRLYKQTLNSVCILTALMNL